MEDNYKLIRRGFTLIELLVVVAIIGILSTIVVINVTGAKASSRYTKTIAEMSEISKATLAYKVEHNSVWPKEWSGYRDWYKDEDDPNDSGSHYFFNNIIDPTDQHYNDFLVDYMGAKRFKPECPKASYAFYNYSTTQVLVYWPWDSSNQSASYLIAGKYENSEPLLVDKETKKLTCNELTEDDLKN